MKASYAFSSFTAGEGSPRLQGRSDLSKYFSMCSTLENLITMPHGGATRRPGTKYVAEVKTSSLATRLIPFEFGVSDVYIIEAGNQYFRFYRNNGQLTSSGSAYEISTPYLTAELFDIQWAQSGDVMYLVHPNHSPRKLTRTGHTAWTLAEVVFELGPMMDENDTTTTLTASALTGSVTITASAVTGINDDTGFQSGDVGRLIKMLDGYAKITAITSTTVVVATVQTNSDLRAELLPAYTASTISFKEGDPSSTGSEHNDRIIDSGKNFIDEGFKIGQKITVSGTSSNNGTYLIVAVTDDTILTAPSDDLADEAASSGNTITGSIEATDEWSLGAFSAQTGYPSAICFYEERLVMAGTTSQPQTIFFSESGGFEQFKDGSSDADAMRYTISSQNINIIRYLQPGRVLVVGTSGGEFAASSSNAGEPLTPTNVQIKRQTTYGSSTVKPVQSGNAVLFLQRAKRKIRELVYNFDVDGYIAPDMTILAEHISEGGFTDMDIQQEPDNVIWVVRADGVLCGLTYRREEQVVAWHRHIIGGISGNATVTVTDYSNIPTGTKLTLTKSNGTSVTFTCQGAGAGTPDTNKFFHNEGNDTTADNIYTAVNLHSDFTVANPAANVVTIYETNRTGTGSLTIESDDTTRLAVANQSNALVESVAVVPGDLDEDQVWVVVQRTINGTQKRFVEYLMPMDFGSDVGDAFFVDSGLTYSGAAATSITGLNHLEGEVVRILADGAAHADKTVSSGAIALDRSAEKVHIGLGYDSTLRTMRIEAGSQDGTAQGKIKRLHHATLRLYRSVGVKVGESSAVNDLIPFRSSAHKMDQPITLYSGDKDIEFESGYDTDGYITVIQDQPLPLTLLSIYIRLQTFDA